ncbi:Rib/alpha-like domain-containing protein, partial [Bifidobacterium pseudocatenulatum]|nr:Rib/alpha-like domain-containing protein [Bifidobacterium pseudocatenulatum]
VKKKPDASVYKAKAVKSASVVRGSVLPAASLIATRAKLPKTTAFAFTVGPNFQKVGSYDTGVVVIYPDGSRQVI